MENDLRGGVMRGNRAMGTRQPALLTGIITLCVAIAGIACSARADVVPATAQDEAKAIAAAAPPPPDYDLASSWSAGPFGPGASAALPAGASPAAQHPAVDVFYVHPTTSHSATAWNQDVRDAADNRWDDESVVARQAGAFSGCCRVFSPRYRAATSKAFISAPTRAAAYAVGYTDVERAFDWYLAHENHGRPFILAGHSQGALQISTLLERRIDGTPLQRRLVAAYVIGNNLAEGEFGLRFHHIGICRTAAQTGCVVQWNAVLAATDLAQAAQRAQQTFIDTYGNAPGRQTLCINPLTFDWQRPVAPASAALGTVTGPPGFGAMQPLRPGAVAAHCDRGLLVVDPAAGLSLDPLPDGAMHYHDIGLFYADVRANAVLRAAAFVKLHRR